MNKLESLTELVKRQEEIIRNFSNYRDPLARKAFYQSLRDNESKIVQLLDIKAGQIFYESWGFVILLARNTLNDQTNIDFCVVVAVSLTKKTVTCQMMGSRRVDEYNVEPVKQFGIIFRLKVSQYNGEPRLRGSYPFCQHNYPTCKLFKREDNRPFTCTKNLPDIENYRFWSGDKKRSWCEREGCSNLTEEQSVDFREGSFSPYEKPVYETPVGMGH